MRKLCALLPAVALVFVCACSDTTAPAPIEPTDASMAMARTQICHQRATGYVLIEVANASLDAHMAHGDGYIGGSYPAMSGRYVFGPDCTPAPAPVFCEVNGRDAVVPFGDPALADEVRYALRLPEGADITCAHMAGLTRLSMGPVSCRYPYPPYCISTLIGDFSGLENAVNLNYFFLHNNGWTAEPLDLSQFAGLTRLTTLFLAVLDVEDISPLEGLANVERFMLHQIRWPGGILPVANMANLEYLDLSSTWLRDLSGLEASTNLVTLFASDNELTDVSALAHLPHLGKINLSGNADLSNIDPLVDNPGVGPGDEVCLGGTAVSAGDVARLEAKGVSVNLNPYGC